MQISIESKSRSSESSSNDSGVIADDPAMMDSTDTDSNKINISTTIQTGINTKTCDNSGTTKIQNGGHTIHIEDIGASQTKPNSSPESTHVSIESINADDIDSSVVDSDSDIDADDVPTNGEFIIQKLGQHMPGHHNRDVIVVGQNKVGAPGTALQTPPRTQIDSIAVQNSTDITFGDKIIYQGPVKIQQFRIENDKWRSKDSNGNVNPAYDGSDTERGNGKSNGKNYPKKEEKKFSLKRKAITITGGIIFAFCILITIILCAVLLTKSKSLSFKLGDGDDSRLNNPIESTIEQDNIGGGKVFRMVSRGEWVGQPPRHELNDLELPATRLIIAHTATENCTTQAQCVFRVRFIQTFHIESRNWDDIGYNFLVGGDGAVYEGRGWDKEGAHTKGFNRNSICIAFVGTFTDKEPPERQIKAAQLLIDEGLRLGKLSPDYKLYGHRQLMATESPGEKLYKIIQKWPHWANDIQQI